MIWTSISILVLSICLLGSSVYMYLTTKELLRRANSTDKRVSTLETHMLRFQEPEAIADDMEATADLIEARMAGRQAMPRPGSLPHARIAKRRDPRGKSGWNKGKP